jgi:hypothetical protein
MRFRGRVILPAVNITPVEIQRQYQKQYGKVPTAERLLLRRIVFKQKDPETLQRAEKLYKALQAGAALETAKNFQADTIDAEATSFMLGDLQASVRDALSPVNAGEYSKPIDTGLGIVIFRVESRAGTLSAEDKGRYEAIERELRALDIDRRLIEWLRQAREKTGVKFLGA